MSSDEWLSDQLRELLRSTYGLDLARGGGERALADHLESRLASRRSARPEHELLERVLANVEGERDQLLHAVTVRHSWFFRDPDQLDEIREFFVRLARRVQRPLDVWVAGCAGGEEAWTLALIADSIGLPLRVLATDVDPLAIAEARKARYVEFRLRDLPDEIQHRLLRADEGRRQVDIAALTERVAVEFAVHNLCDDPPAREFDLVCCRNVLIYIEPTRARAILVKLQSRLRAEGLLMLGSIDQLAGATALRMRTPLPTPPPAPPPSVIEPLVTAKDAAPRSHVHGLLARASEAIAAGRFDEALAELEARVVDDPLEAELYFWIGLAHHQAARPVLAIAAFRRARCLAPELWPASLFAALAHERSASWPAARRCWTELERDLAEPTLELRGSPALLDALTGWRGEALALAKLRASRPHPTLPESKP